MSAGGTVAGVPTDDQVADILGYIARICLEVERGLRPPAHLLSLMDPPTVMRWTQPDAIARFRGGPVHPGQIGRPHISRLSDTHIVATVVTQTEGDRWGALSLRLRRQGGKWRIADLDRLLAATHYRTGPSAAARRDTTPDDPRPRAVMDRRLAEAAHQAARRRLADLPPDAPGYRAASDLVGYWRNKVRKLDRELAHLTTRQHTRDDVERFRRR